MQPLPSSTAHQRGTTHRVDRPTPLSPLPSDDANNVFNERLEIYDGAETPRPSSMKRRRTPSRVALYRQIDIELEEDESSKSSTTYTDSIGHSNSFSAEMGHSLEDTITLEKSESIMSEPTQKFPTGKIDQHTAPPLPDIDDNVPWRGSRTTNRRKKSEMFFSPRNAHSPTTDNIDVSSPGVRETVVDQKTMLTENDSDVQYTCCEHFMSIFKNKNTKKKQIQRPGMSLSEEQRLWRSVLEGDIWDNHYQYVRATSGASDDNQVVDEIEIVPIENDFKSAGSANYAEAENVGMLFVPSKQFCRKDQRQNATLSPVNDSTNIPWWKRDQWKFSPKSKNPGSESRGGTASRARMSVQTKKISNRTEEKNTRPHPYQQQDNVETTMLAPRLSPIQLGRTHSNEVIFLSDTKPLKEFSRPGAVYVDNEYEEEMLHFHQGDNYFPDEPTKRPFQVYNPKLERRINQHQLDTYEVDSSDMAMMLPIPHLYDSSKKEEVPLKYLKSTTPIVETIEADSESILTDLSEMIRQVDERQQDNIVINCEEMTQQNETSRNKNLMNAHVMTSIADESDNASSLQDSREENIAPALLRRTDQNRAMNEKTSPQLYRNEDDPRQPSTAPGHMRTTATEQLHRINMSSMSPKRNRNNDHFDRVTFDQTPDISDHHELHYRRTKHTSEENAKSHRDHSLSPASVDDDCWKRRFQKLDRGRRCEDLIDLTNLQEPTIQAVPRKRSKSPIRLYGDPPVPQHMDGSPIHCPRKPRRQSDPPKRQRSKSPIRLYGDPPVPQHMDGSPIQHRENTKSKPFLERYDGNVERTSESPRQVWDDDLTILKDILTRRNDIADLITAATSPKGNHSLPDGSKIVMLKPVVNVYKIRNEYDDERPISPWRSETGQPNTTAMKKRYMNSNTADRTKVKSPKVSLQVRTVFSDSEHDIAANYGVGRSEQEPLSTMMTVPIDDDDSSIDDELRKLAASEKLLRKELEEVQKRSAVRRWEIDETTTSKVNTCENYRHHNVLSEQPKNRQSNMDSPSNGETLTSSVIDLSCIDIELDRENTLISPLPVASAYQCRDTRTHHSWEDTQYEDSPQKGNVRQHERSCKADAVEDNSSPTISLDEAHKSPFLEMNCASPLDIPMSLSDLSQRLWNIYGKNRSVKLGDTAKQSPGSHGLYVPSLSTQNDNPSRDNRFFESKGSPSQQLQPDNSSMEYVDTDVIIDREPSWGTIEKLYQLSMQSESYVSNIPNERDIECLRRNGSPRARVKFGSNESSNSGNKSDPLFQCIEQADSSSDTSVASLPTGSTAKSYSSSDRENLTDIETLDVFPSSGNTVSEQSFYGALLQLSPRDASVDKNKRTKDPISPRLQSLLVRQKQDRYDEVDKTVHTRSNKSEATTQGIYAELVRRGRHKNKNAIVCTDESPARAQNDNSNIDLHKSPISSVVKRYAWQSSPAKRLERLRELHREMNARQKKEEDESPLTRRLSPARRRATKSLKHKAVVPQPKRETRGITSKTLSVEPNSNVVVQVYMPVTRSPEREVKKLKKDAECRDLVSLASSTRSHSLVAALPPAAKARNAASGKPGR